MVFPTQRADECQLEVVVMSTTLHGVSLKKELHDDIRRSCRRHEAGSLGQRPGPEGLLKLITKNVLAPEPTGHLGHENNRASPERETGSGPVHGRADGDNQVRARTAGCSGSLSVSPV